MNESEQGDKVLGIQLQCCVDRLLEFCINEAGFDFLVEIPHVGKGLFKEGDDDDPVFKFFFPYHIQ